MKLLDIVVYQCAIKASNQQRGRKHLCILICSWELLLNVHAMNVERKLKIVKETELERLTSIFYFLVCHLISCIFWKCASCFHFVVGEKWNDSGGVADTLWGDLVTEIPSCNYRNQHILYPHEWIIEKWQVSCFWLSIPESYVCRSTSNPTRNFLIKDTNSNMCNVHHAFFLFFSQIFIRHVIRLKMVMNQLNGEWE